MVRNVAGDMAELDPEDFYLLSGVEQGMRFSEWVRRDKIPEYANLTRARRSTTGSIGVSTAS